MENKMYDRHSIDVFGIGSNIDIFVTKPLTADNLKADWGKIRTRIAMDYQRNLTDDFERWNFYIFYVVKENELIDKNLKFKIEHDTLSSRKIVIREKILFGKEILNYLVSRYLSYPLCVGEDKNEGLFVKNDEVVKLLSSNVHES